MLLTKHILDAKRKVSDDNIKEVKKEIRKEIRKEILIEFQKDAINQLEQENKELREQISTLMATINMLEKSLDDCRNK